MNILRAHKICRTMGTTKLRLDSRDGLMICELCGFTSSFYSQIGEHLGITAEDARDCWNSNAYKPR